MENSIIKNKLGRFFVKKGCKCTPNQESKFGQSLVMESLKSHGISKAQKSVNHD